MIYDNKVGDANKERAADPLMGAIFTAMARDSEWTQTAMDRIYARNLQEAQCDFIDLYNRVEKIAIKLDSASLFQALAEFSYKASQVEFALDNNVHLSEKSIK